MIELRDLPTIKNMHRAKVMKLPDEGMKQGSDHLAIGAVFSYK